MASPWDFFNGPKVGGPPALGAGGGLGGLQKPAPAAPAGVPQGEPPWVTKAREARKRAKAEAAAKPPMSTTESLPTPAGPKPPPTGGSLESQRGQMADPTKFPGEVFDPYGSGGPFEGQPRPGPGTGLPPGMTPPGTAVPGSGGVPTGPLPGWGGGGPGPAAPPPNMGGIPRGGVMGGQGTRPQPPPMQRIPRNPSPTPPPPKAPRPDAGAVFGKVPGGGF